MTTLTPNPDEELRELRRRAYGPESSGLSSEELARLEDLEARARTAPHLEDAPAPELLAEAAHGQPSIPQPAAAPASAAPAPEVPVATSEPAAPGIRPPWWKRWSLWAAAGVGLGIGVALTLGVTSLGERAPDATQRTIETVPLPSIGYSGQFDQDSLRSYEPWNEVSLWTVERPDGATCLVMAAGAQDDPAGWFGNMQCTLDGLDPQIDFTVWQGLGEMIGSDLPADSSVRFVARNGVIDIWVDTAGEATDS